MNYYFVPKIKIWIGILLDFQFARLFQSLYQIDVSTEQSFSFLKQNHYHTCYIETGF